MVQPLKEEWTIVIPGRWNVSIFNPVWLRKNVFLEAKEITLEIGVEPGLPRRLRCENIIIIPTDDRLLLAPESLDDATLLRMEQITRQILDLLKHTPVTAVGMNYGYKIKPVLKELRDKLPVLFANEFARDGLTIKKREYKWVCEHEPQTLNVSLEADDEEIHVQFNFHKNVTDTQSANDTINGKTLTYKRRTREILENVFGITVEDQV